jgi:hypothetical protein
MQPSASSAAQADAPVSHELPALCGAAYHERVAVARAAQGALVGGVEAFWRAAKGYGDGAYSSLPSILYYTAGARKAGIECISQDRAHAAIAATVGAHGYLMQADIQRSTGLPKRAAQQAFNDALRFALIAPLAQGVPMYAPTQLGCAALAMMGETA